MAKSSFSFLAVAVLLALAGCAVTPSAPGHLTLTPVSFADLPGWPDDGSAKTLAAFRLSCAVLTRKPAAQPLGVAGTTGAWRTVCAAAQTVPDSDEAARAYFENYFQPYAAAGADGDEGLFTGYYAPELRGSLQEGGAFRTPLYARPGDRVVVDLGAFIKDLNGRHIVGKVAGGQLIPYDTRAAIAAGALKGRAQALVWVDDPISAFFLEVQGSGVIRLSDGAIMPVGYDGANGHDYVAIGRVMAARGDIAPPVTMDKIRAWLAAHPAQAQKVMNANPSYVFFRRLPDGNIVGAEGVALTPVHSLAVDPAFVPLGVPLWLDARDGQGAPFRHLLVAQDTGGAIKGAVRGDVFWGAGAAAAAQAGAMQSRGHYYLLLPKVEDSGP